MSYEPKIGERVRVVYPASPFHDCIGTVIPGGFVTVLFDGKTQPTCWYTRHLRPVYPADVAGPQPPAAEPPYWPKSRIDEPLSLPTDSAARKSMPIASGVARYFPRAQAYKAMVSRWGNDKHNPGEALRWSKEKSSDHLDCVARHVIDAGKRDTVSKLRESGFLAWRADAHLEVELEAAEARGEKWWEDGK